MMAEQDTVRCFTLKVFCPRCLTPHPDGYVHTGLASAARRLACGTCRKSYEVRTRVGGDGAPLCEATPVFIRAPEVLEDNNPPVQP